LFHVSVARQRRTLRGTEPLPIDLWLPPDLALAPEIAYRTLAGVGDPRREHWEFGDVALHLRRACTPEEIAALPAGTLARRAAMGLCAL
jgi:hypothetical protein